MKVPTIQNRPITEIFESGNDVDLLQLYDDSNADSQDKSLVRLLSYATMNPNEANKILLRCLLQNKNLQTYYPAIDKQQPKGIFIGTIIDGSLWLV